MLRGAVGGLLSLIALALFIAPTSVSSWLEAFSFSTSERPGVPHVSQWVTATAVTWVRLLLRDPSGGLPQWPLVIIPVCTFTSTLVYFMSIRKRPVIWSEVTPILLCLSLGTSNYGWIFDQSVLMLVQLTLISRATLYPHRGARVGMIAITLGIQLAAITCSRIFPFGQHHFAWLPWALAAILLLDRPLSRRQAQTQPPRA